MVENWSLKWAPGPINHGEMKNNFTTGLYILALFLIFSGTTRAQNDESDLAQKKPNVIILFSDQHNKKVMGFEGHPDVITSNLDKLASEGLIFDRAYCTAGICTPSRSSLLTGLMPRTLGLLSNEGHTSVMEDVVSMATIFKLNHYNTYTFGRGTSAIRSMRAGMLRKTMHINQTTTIIT